MRLRSTLAFLPRLARLLALLCSGTGVAVAAGEVQVAVAANFAGPMARIATAFEQDTGHKAVLSPGATGKHYAQIAHGAPFGVMLAADQATPARLEQEGLTMPGSRFTYARGRLVLWSKDPAQVDNHGAVLRAPGSGRIALADARIAPYGAAAQQTLDAMGLRSALQARLVQGENVATVFQWVSSGNAGMGFVALSQVMVDGAMAAGSGWIVPSHLHAPLLQDAVGLRAARDPAAARALLAYLQGPRARAIMRGYGYEH